MRRMGAALLSRVREIMSHRNTPARRGHGPARSESCPHCARPAAPLAVFDQLGQTLVATLTGESLSGAEALELAAALCARVDPAAGGPARHVVLDLQNVRYMDSACVGVLVELLTRLQNTGGRIALVNADPNVEYLFKLTRLDRLFPICRDVMRAIEAVERAG